MTAPEIRYARSGDIRIAHQVVGSGDLDLVFVPGFVSNLDVAWEEPGMAHFFSRLAAFSRLFLFVVCSLPLFHWAHRFRYTLYDGLQIKHLNEFINVLCYGGAIVGTVVSAYLLWNFH